MASSLQSFSVGWIYIDGNIRETDSIGYTYDKPVAKHVKIDLNIKYHELRDLLFLKLGINKNICDLNIKYRCMNPLDHKYGVIPIKNDDDVELMFGMVVSKGGPYFLELYLEKSSSLLEVESSYMVENPTVGESSSTSLSLNVSSNVQGRATSEKSFYMVRVDRRGMLISNNEFSDDNIPFYRSIDGSKMIASLEEPVLSNSNDMFHPKDLKKGMVFLTKKKLAHAVKQVHIRNHQEIAVTRSNDLNWHVHCKKKVSGCEWKLKARKRKLHGCFETMETSGPHTCLNPSISQDHANINCSDIAEVLKAQVAADPSIREKVLLATVKDKFGGYVPTRKKIRDAKKHALEEVYGSWDESDEDLPHLIEALQSFNVGTKVDWHFKDDEFQKHDIRKMVTFKRVFWAFKPCIDGFEHCIPVIQIDGTHLYGPYPGVLLSATTVDGFNHILLLAFAIVEVENLSSWDWFMDRLRRFVVRKRHGVCVISDRHAGIMAAMKKPGWCEPNDHHRFCVRHLVANFATAHKKAGLKERVVKLAYQVQPKKIELLWDKLIIVEPRTTEWFKNKPFMKWALAFDEAKRFGIMTTNHAESWNNAILSSRKLPVTSLVKALFYKIVEYFDHRRLEIVKQSAQGQTYTKNANKMLNRSKVRDVGHNVRLFDRDTWLFEVTTRKDGQKGGNNHTVRITESLCTCGKWQTYKIPCSHLIACCASKKISYDTFVGEWYKLENASKVYAGKFEPIPDKGTHRWPSVIDFPKVVLQ